MALYEDISYAPILHFKQKDKDHPVKLSQMCTFIFCTYCKCVYYRRSKVVQHLTPLRESVLAAAACSE